MNPPIRPQTRNLALAALAVIVLAFVIFGLTESDDEPELSVVEQAPLRLFDDGAGQRHFEVSYPKGLPRATMLLIHGQGWVSQSLPTFAGSLDLVKQLTDDGFRVVAISTDQSPTLDDLSAEPDGNAVLDDVLAFHDQVRDAFPDEPVCAHGASGGGHLALMLAVERPGLDCVSAIAPPTDLVGLVRDAKLGENPAAACSGLSGPARGVGSSTVFGACVTLVTWGTSNSALREASPARRWPGDGTPLWAAFLEGDPLVPDSQRRALAGAASGEIEVIDADPKGPVYVHARVSPADQRRTARSWKQWLNEVVPKAAGNPELPDEEVTEGVHTACNSRLAPGRAFSTASRRDRSDLLASAGRWRPSTSSALVAATNSCDGAEDEQESGLMLWVPGYSGGRYVERGTAAEWVFKAPEGSVAASVTASFRGFLANPGIWRIGLYARGSATEDWSAVVECDGQRCGGFETAPGAVGGTTIVPRGTGGDPDSRNEIPEQTFTLTGQPTELKWELRCIDRRGCLPRSINPGGNPEAGDPRRPIDPSGRPAVLSLYELQVTTSER